MKKYISILSLIAALFMQSCERSESDLNPTEHEKIKIETLKNKESSKNADVYSEAKGSNNFETGDDDEPKKDKQHWRTVRDTIW
ncbi:hypothetical protein SAMN05421856_103312 [Chryseobacterium taichungense]|uniref:Lipoprotein n=1 Tax=Chryseobacterium taichungense TaxID=295069 RepID=A0A1H7YJ28_9FLAO|nr:hypothetical protein [Chryseobacterium taichungense]SEM45149.1 hypothetical protein SAMN05421856_103312 [Chryseobacterium taichungense]